MTGKCARSLGLIIANSHRIHPTEASINNRYLLPPMDSARRPYTAPRPSANRIGSCSAYTFQCNPIYHSYSLHNNLQLTKHPIKTVHNYTYQNNNETQLNIFHHDTHNQIIYSMHLMPMSDGRFYRAILSADKIAPFYRQN